MIKAQEPGMWTTERYRRQGSGTATFHKLTANYHGINICKRTELETFEDKNVKLKTTVGRCHTGKYSTQRSVRKELPNLRRN